MPKPKTPPTLTAQGLGTHWIFELLGDESGFPRELAVLIRDSIELFDDTYSRFKPDSLVGQLNRNGFLVKPPKELVDMFAFAHKMHSVTGGVFDISVGGSLQKLGYGTDSETKGVYPGFWETTEYDTNEIRIARGAAIDLGGFGKGWLLDKLAVLLEQHNHPYYLINGGGDIVLSAQKPIELGLEHPYDTSKIIGTTQILKGALAVSSTVKRRWVKNGKTYHHIIDPKTTMPADTMVVSTYVKGATGLIADTIATVLLINPALETKLRDTFDVHTIVLHTNQIDSEPGF